MLWPGSCVVQKRDKEWHHYGVLPGEYTLHELVQMSKQQDQIPSPWKKNEHVKIVDVEKGEENMLGKMKWNK